LLLTFPCQRRWRSDDLDAYGASGGGGCGVNRLRVHSVDVCGGVVQVEGTRGFHAFGAENGHC